MALSNELISEFAKITNDAKTSRIDEVVLYGEVVKCDDTVYVRFDGSDELTPVTTVTEKDETGEIVNFKYGAASVKTGDRVSVLLKNHSATITGNLSDPPMGRAEVKITEDSIIAQVGEDVKVQIDALGVQIQGLTTFQNGLENGTTSIDGGCIKTGTIDAARINLKSIVTYQYSETGEDDTWHSTMSSSDMYRRESLDGGKTWGEPYQFKGKDGQNGMPGSDASVPSYIEIRGIDFTDITGSYIKSPKIYSGEFYGTEFNVISDGRQGAFNLYGDYDGTQLHVLSIEYYASEAPYVNINSPDEAVINFGNQGASMYFGSQNGSISFIGPVSFQAATVSGLTATFA